MGLGLLFCILLGLRYFPLPERSGQEDVIPTHFGCFKVQGLGSGAV